ncbi:hypothetical protein DPMN_127770 [Dreissena polymorpha]|uniref:Uncharacterized protein n=1 Tax=Dreissena polymorpha TaxID=45954 RepID=A0A9D4GY77_DREPO|nr:hypothetical protein DPMN_127770 [Dreissena polymorpha]
MPGVSRYTGLGRVVSLIRSRDSAQTCLVRHRRTTARKNTTVLRISMNLRWNRWISLQDQNMILVARAVVQMTD